jgi:DNA mismatch repair protein MutH
MKNQTSTSSFTTLATMAHTDIPSNQRKDFHGWVGALAQLKTGETVKIKGGHKFTLFVQKLDGTIEECYHEDLVMIMEA